MVYKWIARDEDGELWFFENKPVKNNDCWDQINEGEMEVLTNSLDLSKLESIKWQDEQPTELQKVKLINKHSGNLNSVTQPAHYHSGSIDPIAFGEENFSQEEMKGFYRMNAIKYISRYDKKNGLEDLEKAAFYLDKLKELTE